MSKRPLKYTKKEFKLDKIGLEPLEKLTKFLQQSQKVYLIKLRRMNLKMKLV